MRVIIYEDNQEKFYPLTNLFPQFGLRLGAKVIAEHTASFFKRNKMAFAARAQFGLESVRPAQPSLYLSGRLLLNENFRLPAVDTELKIESETVGFFKKTPPYPNTLDEIKEVITGMKESKQVNGMVVRNIWDLITHNTTMLIKHYSLKRRKGSTIRNAYVKGKNIHVAKGAKVHKLTFLDVTDGPIFIDRDAEVRPFSTVIGPSYIGTGAIIDQAKVVRSSIGPYCRIGGEVEDSIFQGYSNKHHEGFIGHSFIGEWVNLGALTTNSDLKNNYGTIRVHICGKDHDTGAIKLGCFIGDHSKLGIGTLIPTGAVIGSFVNFAGGGMMPRFVRDFQWIVGREEEDYDLEKAIRTAQIVMKRRNVNMSRQYKETIRFLHGKICRSN